MGIEDIPFQSQTRRLLPRNSTDAACRYRPARFQSQTRRLLPRNRADDFGSEGGEARFNRRRDACFLATQAVQSSSPLVQRCFNRRRDACFLATCRGSGQDEHKTGFNRRRDACFLATFPEYSSWREESAFQSQTRRLLPRNRRGAILSTPCQFQSQTRRLLPRNKTFRDLEQVMTHLFQSQTRRLLPRNRAEKLEDSFLCLFQSQTRRLLPRNAVPYPISAPQQCFNRRRDACFLATSAPKAVFDKRSSFQSQTRRLLPRNQPHEAQIAILRALFQSQTRRLLPRNQHPGVQMRALLDRFNRRRDACFLATIVLLWRPTWQSRFQSQTRRLLPRNKEARGAFRSYSDVSIADATLASSQRIIVSQSLAARQGFNRRRDACFLATASRKEKQMRIKSFNRRRDACFLATPRVWAPGPDAGGVSIADATLASSQRREATL